MSDTNTAPVKPKQKLGLWMVIASLFFLFNADINVIDAIPDVFGYILMTAGLSYLSLMNDSIAEARAAFSKMILISAGKLVSILFIFGMNDAANRPTSFLLFSFSFAVAELLMLIPAYNKLFYGILTLADRYDGKTAYLKKDNDKRNYTEKIHIFTLAFVIVKAVCSTLPEFISLVTTEYTDSFVMYLYDYIGTFRIMTFIPALALGIVWLTKTVKYFKALGNDSTFTDNVNGYFVNDIAPKEGIFIKRTLNTVMMILVVASVFCIDFPMGSVGLVGDSITEINVIPDFIAAILFLIASHKLRYYVKDTKRTRIASSVYLATSLIASAAKLLFIARFDHFTAINKLDEAYYMFYGMCAVTVVENIAFVVAIVMLTFTLREIIERYTGYAAYSDLKTSERVTSLQKELTANLKYMIIFAVLGAITAVVYEFLLPEKHLVAQYMWMIDLVAQAIFTAFSLKCLFAIKDEVNNRFMLEI